MYLQVVKRHTLLAPVQEDIFETFVRFAALQFQNALLLAEKVDPTKAIFDSIIILALQNSKRNSYTMYNINLR